MVDEAHENARPSNENVTFEVPPPSASPMPLPDSKPSAMQWALSFVLVTLLLVHLVRIWRVLRGENTLVLQHSAPEGMRTVQCGQCQRMQYLQITIRTFICYNCMSGNRLSVDALRSSSTPELVENTGPCKRYEFRRQGNLYWQMLKEETDDGQTVDCADATAHSADNSSLVTEKSSEADLNQGNEPVPPPDMPPVFSRPPEEEPTQREANDADAGAGESEDAGWEAKASGSRRRRSSRGGQEGGGEQSEWEQCGVCWDNPGPMVLLPCSHGSVCQECATRIAQNRASGGAHCPHCRANISMLVRLTELIHGDSETRARGVEHRVPIARVLGSPVAT